MENLIKVLKVILTRFKNLYIRCYSKVKFLFNNRTTIKKMYSPIITNKIKTNQELLNQINKLKKENQLKAKAVNSKSSENKRLKIKINLIQELLVKK